MNCTYCKGNAIKRGKSNGKQRYKCKCCGKSWQISYTRPRIPQEKYSWVHRLNNEGCGISSIARLLSISKSSVQRMVMRLAARLVLPAYSETNQSYEVDELQTYCGSKQSRTWLCYAINRTTGNIITFIVGRRTKENLQRVVASLLNQQAKRIYTDGLNTYGSLIPSGTHSVFIHCTNKIERKNLTLRTHLKRLARKTLCFSKSEAMLRSCVQLYISVISTPSAR